MADYGRDGWFEAREVDPPHALVWWSERGEDLRLTWALVLDDRDDGGSDLHVRLRINRTPGRRMPPLVAWGAERFDRFTIRIMVAGLRERLAGVAAPSHRIPGRMRALRTLITLRRHADGRGSGPSRRRAPRRMLPAFTSGNGITVQAVQRLDPRLYALTVTTGAVDGTLHIRVLLPDGYAQHPGRRYPVLYLFHGTSGGAADWTDQGAAEATTAGRPLITVMPDIGVDDNGGGYCTDWFNGGRGGRPMWETFEIGQVVPFVDRVLRTRATRAGRAIAGLSQGGFCAFSLAARHPDMFTAAASFSGAIDTAADPISAGADDADHPGDDNGPGRRLGSRRDVRSARQSGDQLGRARSGHAGRQPARHAALGLHGQRTARPAGPRPGQPGRGRDRDRRAHPHDNWKAAADAAGVPVAYTDYGPGTHSWPYWKRDLQWIIGPLSAVLAAPPAAPALKAYTTAENPWSQWGYQVAITRPAREFSTLSRAGAAGFTLAGSGAATVLTPGQYRRGSRHRVQIRAPMRTAA